MLNFVDGEERGVSSDDPPEGAAFGWVPSGADEATHFVRPRTAELPVRKETSAALELFDEVELELEAGISRVASSAGHDPSARQARGRERVRRTFKLLHGRRAGAESPDPTAMTRSRLSGATRPGRKRARRRPRGDADVPRGVSHEASDRRRRFERRRGGGAVSRAGRSYGFHRRYRRGAHPVLTTRVEGLVDADWRRRSRRRRRTRSWTSPGRCTGRAAKTRAADLTIIRDRARARCASCEEMDARRSLRASARDWRGERPRRSRARSVDDSFDDGEISTTRCFRWRTTIPR